MTFIDSAQSRGRRSGHIKLHGPEGFAGMRKAGRLTAEALDLLAERVKPGVTTNALDKFVYEFARDHGAYPAPLLYRGFASRSAPRSTTSSATASPTTSRCATATSSTST